MISEHAFETEVHKQQHDLSGLYRIGGIASMLLVIYSLATMVQMIVLGGRPRLRPRRSTCSNTTASLACCSSTCQPLPSCRSIIFCF